MDGVHVAPMGLSWGYATMLLTDSQRKTGRAYAETIIALGQNLATSISAKTRGILASWGRVASHLDDLKQVSYIRNLMRNGLLFGKSDASPLVVLKSMGTRRELRLWAASAAGRAAGVELRRLTSFEWWAELPKYRFLLCPIGAAVQTAKVVEALLVLTVPIVEPMGYPVYDEIIKLGFPLVLVKNWTAVTRASTEVWWRELAPRLESFRRNCITVEAYWRMYTGDLRRCE
eukprot:UN1594